MFHCCGLDASILAVQSFRRKITSTAFRTWSKAQGINSAACRKSAMASVFRPSSNPGTPRINMENDLST